MEIESQNEGSTDNDDDYHDDQSDQPKKSARFYKWGKSDEGKITKISRNLSRNNRKPKRGFNRQLQQLP